jgi:hypothetical protein
MSVAVVYTLFSLISLVAAVVLFGILHSTGALSFVTEGYVKQAEFGGSFAGFLATLIFLIRSYNSTVERATLSLVGHVFWKDGNHPAADATVFVEGAGLVRKTDSVGHFKIDVPDLPTWTLHASHGDATATAQVPRSALSKPVTLRLNKTKSAAASGSIPVPTLEAHHVLNRPEEASPRLSRTKTHGDDVP